MKTVFSTSVLVWITAGFVYAGLDLTPSVSDYKSEGIVYKRVSFNADDASVTYVPPFGWNMRGSADRLTLSPPNKNLVEAAIQTTPLSKPQPLDEATLQTLEQQVLAEVPAGSHSVELISREENPVPIANCSTYKFVVAYSAMGQRFQRSVIFANMPDARLTFRISAPRSDFASMEAAFRSSLLSWTWAQRKPAAGNTTAAASAQ